VLNVATVVARGRAAAEALMVDACTIERETGSTTDQASGVVTPTYDTIYDGKCRFQQASIDATTAPDVGEAQVYLEQTILQLPATATGVHAEGVVTCTASALDPDLPGRQWFTLGVSGKTHATARRIQLREVGG
jgi:hypothetical protein